jgi:hypothetical protein
MRVMALPISENAFLVAGDGMICPYKWFHAKKIQLFHMMSDEVELYLKIVEVDEI